MELFKKFAGIYVALNQFGNCFAPALCIATNWRAKRFSFGDKSCYPAKVTITLRARNFTETNIYWRGWFRLDWNSGYLARRFGKFHETDFGGYYKWRNHIDL